MNESVGGKGHNVTTSPMVRNNYCIGCGVCAGVCPSGALSMQVLGDEFRPVQTGTCLAGCSLCAQVCPFGQGPDDETTIAAELYGVQMESDSLLGRFLVTDAGYVRDEESRRQSASGGAASLMLARLIESKLADAVVTTMPVAGGFPWYAYRIITTPGEVAASRGSIYQPLHLSDVIREMLEQPQRRYAVMALPCYAKALRKAARRVVALDRCMKFVLGLTCGGSSGFAYPLATAMLAGVSKPQSIRYHVKSPASHGRLFGFSARDEQGCEKSIGQGGGIATFLRASRSYRKGCLFCDDIFAELTDATFMDAWLPQFESDRRGTSLVVIRHAELAELWRQVRQDGIWQDQPIDPREVIASQGKLCQFKRELLKVRLDAAMAQGRWTPPKRSFLLNADSSNLAVKLVRQNERRVAACDTLGEVFGTWFQANCSRRFPPLRAKLMGWRLCSAAAAILRSCGVRSSSGRWQLFWRGMSNLLSR